MPARTAIFAVGDVHGHLGQFEAMLHLLEERIAAARARGQDAHLVLIGDYIDRGPSSLGVLEALVGLERRLRVPVHRLCGNHDRYLSDFLLAAEADPTQFALWMENGGESTLAEFGLDHEALTTLDLLDLKARARNLVPSRVLKLLASLQLAWRLDGWLFVHGGIEPMLPLAAQEPERWTTMREPFLSGGGWTHDFCVVHGHTICGPAVLPHRVAIDSGVYKTGLLTAVELADDAVRFHGVTSQRQGWGGGPGARWRAVPQVGDGRRRRRRSSIGTD